MRYYNSCMSSFLRKLVLALIMAMLPLQGALAAIMPLCVQAGQVLRPSAGVQPPVQAPVHATANPCSQHDASNGSPRASPERTTKTTIYLVMTHLLHKRGRPAFRNCSIESLRWLSFTAPFNSRFTSLILPQPQRPPRIGPQITRLLHVVFWPVAGGLTSSPVCAQASGKSSASTQQVWVCPRHCGLYQLFNC